MGIYGEVFHFSKDYFFLNFGAFAEVCALMNAILVILKYIKSDKLQKTRDSS